MSDNWVKFKTREGTWVTCKDTDLALMARACAPKVDPKKLAASLPSAKTATEKRAIAKENREADHAILRQMSRPATRTRTAHDVETEEIERQKNYSRAAAEDRWASKAMNEIGIAIIVIAVAIMIIMSAG
jgi:hypothetical protein